MKKIALLALILSLSLLSSIVFCAPENNSGRIPLQFRASIDSDEITSILNELDNNTLVIFDIDYTLLRSKTSLGTPEWFSHLMYREMAKGKTNEEGYHKWYPIWMKSQQFNEIELMDRKIPKLLEFIKKKKGSYIGLTHRNPVAAEMTEQQFSKLGIKFEKSFPYKVQYASALKIPALYQNGVLYCHDFNEKGVVFLEWFYAIQKQLGKCHFKKIVFIDDAGRNVASMAFAVKALGLQYIGVRYSAADKIKPPLNRKLVEQQAKILRAEYPEEKTQKLLMDSQNRLVKS